MGAAAPFSDVRRFVRGPVASMVTTATLEPDGDGTRTIKGFEGEELARWQVRS